MRTSTCLTAVIISVLSVFVWTSSTLGEGEYSHEQSDSEARSSATIDLIPVDSPTLVIDGSSQTDSLSCSSDVYVVGAVLVSVTGTDTIYSVDAEAIAQFRPLGESGWTTVGIAHAQLSGMGSRVEHFHIPLDLTAWCSDGSGFCPDGEFRVVANIEAVFPCCSHLSEVTPTYRTIDTIPPTPAINVPSSDSSAINANGLLPVIISAVDDCHVARIEWEWETLASGAKEASTFSKSLSDTVWIAIAEPYSSARFRIRATAFDTSDNVASTAWDTVNISTSSDVGTIHGRWAVTNEGYPYDTDRASVVASVFGPGWRVADWNDLLELANTAGSAGIVDLFDRFGWALNSSYGVTRNDNQFYSSTRAYGAARHDHNLPPGYLAHDNIDNYLLSLGSWDSPIAILAVSTEPLPAEESLTEGWESGFSKWSTWGYPDPVLRSSLGVGGSVGLDPNGDSYCASGLLSQSDFVWAPGSVLEFEYKLNAERIPRPEHFSWLGIGLARSQLVSSGACAGQAPDTDLRFNSFGEQDTQGLRLAIRNQGDVLSRPTPWTEDGKWHHVSILGIGPDGGPVDALKFVQDDFSTRIALTDTMPARAKIFIDGRSVSTVNVVDNLSLESGHAFLDVARFPDAVLGSSSRSSVVLHNELYRDVGVRGIAPHFGSFDFTTTFTDSLSSGFVIPARDSVVTQVGFAPTVPGPVEVVLDLFSDTDGSHVGSLRLYGEALRPHPENFVVYDNFDDGILRWNDWGVPKPRLLVNSGYGGSAGIDPNGDGWCKSGIWSRDTFLWRPGTQIEYMFKTNTELDPRQMYHQSVGLCLTNGRPIDDSQFCSFDGVDVFLSHATNPNTSGETHSLSISGIGSLINEPYTASEDGVWHHVRLHALGLAGGEVDSLELVMDGDRQVFDISESVIPDTVALAIQGRSLGMTNCFDNIRVSTQAGVHGSLVLPLAIATSTHNLTLQNESMSPRMVQLADLKAGAFHFTAGFAESLATGFEMGPGQVIGTNVLYFPEAGLSDEWFLEFHDPLTKEGTGSLFLRASAEPLALNWENRDDFGEQQLVYPRGTTTIVIDSSSDVEIDSLLISVGSGGGADIQQYAMTNDPDSGGRFSFVIPPKKMGIAGLRWQLAAYYKGQELLADKSWHFMRTVVDSLEMDSPLPARSYSLVSLPAEPETGQFANMLWDDLGIVDVNRWRMFRYDNSSSDYVEQGDGMFFPIDQGQSYWLIVENEIKVGFAPDKCKSTPADHPFEISLKPGWNLIGNPFAFPVDWSSVTVNDSTIAEQSTVSWPTWWDWEASSYTSDRSVLQPFGGCWVKNFGNSIVTLAVPPTQSEEPDKAGPCLGEDDWMLSLAVQSGPSRDSDNHIGSRKGAYSGWDLNDRSEAPMAPGYCVALAFLHDDWESHSGRFSSDIRENLSAVSEMDTGQTADRWWNFDVAKNFALDSVADRVDLKVTGLETLPDNYQAILVDRELDRVVPLSSVDSYQYNLGHRDVVKKVADCRFAIYVGPPAGFDPTDGHVAPQPLRSRIRTCYPNPFNPSVVVRYELARSGSTKVEIFDVAGRRVRSLLDGNQIAGVHELTWNGQTDTGMVAAAGQYFCRLSTPSGVSATRKITLLK